jgi:Tat protein secretion system quality control protein TatD with DNase activity
MQADSRNSVHNSAFSSQLIALSLIDTHCHLEMDEFNPDRDEVIKRAKDAGIEAIITIGSDLKGNIGGLELSKKYDSIYSSVGFHPHDAKDFTEDIFNQIKIWVTLYRMQDARCKMQDARCVTKWSAFAPG